MSVPVWIAAIVGAVAVAGLATWAYLAGWRVRLVWDGHGEPDDELVEF